MSPCQTGPKYLEKLFETGKKRLGWTLCFLRFLFSCVLVLVAVSLTVVSRLYLYVIYTYDDQLDSRYSDLVQNSSVYDASGDQISEFKAEENRRTVGGNELGEYLPQAVVAVEDRRFYEHYGVDFAGIGRAAWEDLQTLTVSQGGSTITEQLTKNLYISEERWGNASL